MQRAVFHGQGGITVDEAPRPEPGPGELLIAVGVCALCGSDRGAWERGSRVTPGHEIAGTVVARGPGAETAVGARGAVFLVAYCGEGVTCRAGGREACLAKQGMIGFDRDGGFAEYAAVPERCFLAVDDQLGLDAAALAPPCTRCGSPAPSLPRRRRRW